MTDEPILDIGVAEHTSGSDRRMQETREQRSRNEKRRGLALGGLMVALALLVLALVPWLTRGDDSAAEAAADVPAQQAPPETAESATLDDDASVEATPEEVGTAGDEETSSGEDPVEDAESASAGSFEPPSAEHLRADDVALLFSNTLNTPGVRNGLAFVADERFIVLDDRGITETEPEIAQDFTTVSNYSLLVSNGRTWAINGDDRDQTFLVSNSYVVVNLERPGTMAVVNPEARAAIGILSAGLPIPSLVLPEGADLLYVQGRGPLVLPRTGGTFEMLGTAQSLERINDERAVAASLGATVYERCGDDLRCTYFATIADDAVEYPLEVEEATRFTPSPAGDWVLAAEGDAVWLIDTRTQERTEMLPGEPDAVAWTVDGSYVAIVRGDVLEVTDPLGGPSVVVRLNHVPEQSSLLAFASSE